MYVRNQSNGYQAGVTLRRERFVASGEDGDFRLWIFLACGSLFLQAKMVDTLHRES
jgi:hypothetical protein